MPDVFFVVDDATGTDGIWAINSAGAVLAAIPVEGMDAVNAEALSTGPCEADSSERCLYIGDIGDNRARRESVSVYQLREPVVETQEPAPAPAAAQRWNFTYPDGAHDAETLLVAEDRSIIIVTKPDRGTKTHRVYEGAAGGGELLLVNTFEPPAPIHPAQSLLVGNVVTDGSMVAGRVLLLTYDQAIEYVAPTPGADPALFADWPHRQVPTPAQWQSEGVTYLAAAGVPACGYAVISESGGTSGAALGGVACL
ncbi:hypothetical protein [Nakamurella antarctica]|uniref:hypothetical protein n=1 Tax=Nakamurella antarctica TaxID=1902245 RepID=UPI0013DDEF81|nr:hypothetical protein [Nakamurella antarctica]